MHYRIQERQTILQFYLQNQIDVDRQILAQREPVREVNGRIRSLVLRNAALEERKNFLAEAKELQENIQKFWEAYETRYSAAQRPFLTSILAETQEARLEEEELQTVRSMRLRIDAYFGAIKISPFLNTAQPVDNYALETYLGGLIERRNDIYDSLNALADIRYIFAQRIVFYISGENDRQQGFFNSIFISLGGLILVVTLLEYFYIHRPFGDIMSFLKDMSQGKRGQRLYFSSPIREIKESEEIINEFVNKAESHEQEK